MNSRYLRFFIFGIVCAVFASCGGAAFGAPTDPCSLLTPAQVSAALGVTVGPGHAIATKLCEWKPEGPVNSKTPKLYVTIDTPRGFEMAKIQVGGGITKTPVSGVGDEAVSGTTPKIATVLTVKKGDFVFAVRIFPFSEGDEIKAKEKELALQILAKI
jgi:hypothetical protein